MLSRPQIAALRHHGKFNLQPLSGNAPQSCPWLLVSPDAIGRLHTIVNLEGWRFIGTLRRPTSAERRPAALSKNRAFRWLANGG